MAACSNKGGKCDEIACDVWFDGGLKSSVRAELINELVKYLLYERQQIPVTYNEIQLEIGKVARSNCKIRKAKEVMNALDQLFAKIVKAFECCPEIDKMLLILGGTIVSPKEIYVINFPPPCPHVESMPQRASKMCLFRQLISLDPLAQAKTISPTSMSVMLQAPRNSDLSWFVPKPTYRVPCRGKQFVLNFICRQPVSFTHNLTVGEDVEISGIEPLEYSCTKTESLLKNGTGLTSPESSTDEKSKSQESSSCHGCTVTPIVSGYDRSTLVRSADRSSASSAEFHFVDSRQNGTAAAAAAAAAAGGETNSLSDGFATSSACWLEEFKAPLCVGSGARVQVPRPSLHSTPIGHLCPATDSIWFQAPVTVKGYRDKPPASSCTSAPGWLQ